MQRRYCEQEVNCAYETIISRVICSPVMHSQPSFRSNYLGMPNEMADMMRL